MQLIKSPQERASLGDNWRYHINFASLTLIVINSLVTIAGLDVLKAFLEEGPMNQTEMKWSVSVFLAFSTAPSSMPSPSGWPSTRATPKRSPTDLDIQPGFIYL